MTGLQKGLLIGAVSFILLIGACTAGFYFKVYKPYASPIMAMTIGKALEDAQLKTKDFVKPGSGELTAEQVRRFVAVEEAVETSVAGGRTVLAEQQSVLERADAAGELTVMTTLPVFGAIKDILVSAKPPQIDAMNREHFSKREFEWVRDQLYRAADVRLTRIDTSDITSGVPEPGVKVRTPPVQEIPAANQALARPIAAKLEAWRTLAFFGL
jgi:hypothetical protein